ncbi:MAG: hypothetical protein QW112_01810 [Candidatus Micrarchaeia archaeon]
MRALLSLLVVVVALINSIFATSAEMLEPMVKTINDGEIINLGKIGPGQTIDIVVNGVVKQARFGIEGRWQVLRVVELPEGWQGFDSKELATRMKAGVKAAADAKDGDYKIAFRLEEDPNKQQGLGTVTFYIVISISRDILNFTFQKEQIETGVGQPARYPITLKSTSAASDVFDIYCNNMPTWNYKKSVHIPAGGAVSTFYEISSNEEKEYKPIIIIKSQSSDEVKIEKEVNLIVKTDVVGDIKATKNGVLLFPIVLEPLYSLLGIIGSFL